VVVVAAEVFSLLFCPRPLNSSLFNEYSQSIKKSVTLNSTLQQYLFSHYYLFSIVSVYLNLIMIGFNRKIPSVFDEILNEVHLLR